jgi:tetratricopeptide (TPR) repeat protein
MSWLALCAVLWLSVSAQEPAPPPLDEAIAAAREALKGKDRAAAVQSWETAWLAAATTPPDDPRRYEILKQLCGLAASDRRWDKAEEWLQRAIHWRETTQPQPDPKLREDLTLLAYYCKARGELERGVFLLQRTLSMTVQAGGFEHLEVADLLSRIADFEVSRKELPRAEGVLRNALDIRRKKLGEDHVSLAVDLEKLGAVCNQQRKYAEAEAAFEKALGLKERAISQEIDLVNALDGLAYAQFGLREYAGAESNYQRIVSIWAAAAGQTHPMVAASLDKLVVFYRKQERHSEAKSAWKRAVAVRAHNLAESLAREAGERLAQGNIAESSALYQRARQALDPAEPLHAALRQSVDAQLAEIPAASRKAPMKPAAKAPGKKSD